MPINANFWPNGLGADTGDSLVLDSPLYTGATVLFVSSVIGDDANTGLERLQPKATLQAAVTASFAGYIIVLAADHDEVVAAAVVLLAGMTIVGEGKSGGDATAQLSVNSSSASVLTANAVDIELRNVKFPTNPQSNDTARVRIGASVSADDFLLKDCLFECTGTDAAAGFQVEDADRLRIEGGRFVATNTGGTNSVTPVDVAQAGNGMRIEDLVVDAGAVGFIGGYGLDANTTSQYAVISNLSLLGGADLKLAESMLGRVNPQTTDGATRVTFEEPP
jgi:hypothetical protein